MPVLPSFVDHFTFRWRTIRSGVAQLREPLGLPPCSMATRNCNPRYEYPVSRFRNSLLSGIDRGAFPDEASANLDRIRLRAKEVWLQPIERETTYLDFYKDQLSVLDEPTSHRTRPSSPTRLNNPHPPLVFLANRLHSIPGYHNADAAQGQTSYRVDASVPSAEQERRRLLRCKYTTRPNTAAVNQFSSWKNDESAEQGGIDKENYSADIHGVDGLNPNRFFPSLHRYLKGAGAAERKYLTGVQNRYCNQTLGSSTSRQGDRTYPTGGSKSAREWNRYTPRHAKRGDFLIHPEWPPTVPHHRLNGLSSPYFPGQRGILQPTLKIGV